MKHILSLILVSLFISTSAFAQTVRIADLIWSTKNLDVAFFLNGDPIPEAKTNLEWQLAGQNRQPAWCYYNNDPSMGAKYGKLYNWYAVNDPRGLAPTGMRIPTDLEMEVLSNSLGGKEVAGRRLKSNIEWTSFQGQNGNGDNSSGFSWLPAGYRDPNGSFYDLGFYSAFWSSTESGTGGAWDRSLISKNDQLGRNGGGTNGKAVGLSVRCIISPEAFTNNSPVSPSLVITKNSSTNTTQTRNEPRSVGENSGSVNFVRIGKIDVMTTDLGYMNFYQAKNVLEALGGGWRLPNESELSLMFNNQDKIGTLSKKPLSVEGNRRYTGNYLGGTFGAYYATLNTYINPGLTHEWTWNTDSRQNEYFYVRAVREMSSAEKVTQMLNAYSEVEKIARQYNINTNDAENRNSSTSANKSNASGQVCYKCKPDNEKGWYIQDFNPSSRTYSNGRYILKPGYKPCDICHGTGDCRMRCSGGKRDCPGICDDKGTCVTCHGDRFIICAICKGTGRQ